MGTRKAALGEAPLTLEQARALHLAAQGLLTPPARVATRADLRQCIARMGLLQIDTIHVVARSPYLVLWSRLGDYAPGWLDEALAAGHLFETWAHEACFAPRADLLDHRAVNRHIRRHWGLDAAERHHTRSRQHLDALLDHIREKGPVRSADFEPAAGQGRSSPWWGWKDEKRWLETLFARGELMVTRRDKFQRVYDLAERVAPAEWAIEQAQTESDRASAADTARAAFVERSIEALGITQARWVQDYYRLKPRLTDADLQPLVEAGRVLRLDVQGWDRPAYVHRRHQTLLRQAHRGTLQPTLTTVLSPFDPVVWDRERASTLFGFDYRLECYTPEPKRQYGYFVLPVLCRGALIGRLDAKAHRSEGVFEIKALHAEPGLRWTVEQVTDVAQAIVRMARWHATPQVVLPARLPRGLAMPLRRAVAHVMAQAVAQP